jgi:hypothetical protein
MWEQLKFGCLSLIALHIVATPAPAAYAQDNCSSAPPTPESKLTFTSSDAQLVHAFDWAEGQAMAYVQGGSDPVGLWYETGLPGRTRFSMRDTSHQSMGAQALGLAAYTHNMLHRKMRGLTAAAIRRSW